MPVHEVGILPRSRLATADQRASVAPGHGLSSTPGIARNGISGPHLGLTPAVSIPGLSPATAAPATPSRPAGGQRPAQFSYRTAAPRRREPVPRQRPHLA